MGNSNSTSCPVPSDAQSLDVVGTAHRPMMYVAAASAALTFISSVALIILHLKRYRAPKEQRQIIRIVFAPFVFAIICWAQIAHYNIAEYLIPISGIYESLAICSLFLLYIQFAVPGATFGEDMFEAIDQAAGAQNTHGSRWAKILYVMVFQYPVIEVIATIILEVTEAAGTFCVTSLKPRYAHLWVSIIRTIGVIACVMAIIRFYKRLRPIMKARNAMTKLFAFKLIIFLSFVQTWLFSILVDKDVIKASAQFSYADNLYGLPDTILAAEMVLFSAFFWYAFSAAEYSSSVKSTEPLGFLHATIDALNPSDLVLGVVQAAGLLMGLRRSRADNSSIVPGTKQPGNDDTKYWRRSQQS